MTAHRSCVFRIFSGKRSGDHTPHAMLSCQQLSCDPAAAVQFFYRHYIFMCGDLEHTVRRCIDDQLPCADLFPAVVPDHFCPRIRPVAQYASSCTLFKFTDDLLRKSFRIRRKGPFRYKACDLPVPYRCIFSRGLLLHFPIASYRFPFRFLKRGTL